MTLNPQPPHVTVVIPTYNRSWGLRRAVDSVLTQSFAVYELVIVDDASSDDTEVFARSFTDRRVRYHRQPANVGIAPNWGTGIDLARGEYIALLMDDDGYEPTFLERRVAALLRYPTAQFAFSGYRIVGPDEAPIGEFTPPLSPGQILTGPDLLSAVLAKHCFVGATLYRAGALREVWAATTTAHWVLDFAVNLQLATRPDAAAVYIGGQDFVMTQHPGQISQARQQEVFVLVARELERGMGEPHPRWARRLIRNELSSWLTVAGRSAAVRGERQRAFLYLLRAARLRPFADGPWKQLVRVVTGL